MNAAIRTSEKLMEIVSAIEYMEDGPKRWASGALHDTWAIVAQGEESVDATYEICYRDRRVACIEGLLDARDFVAIQSAIARSAEALGGTYDPANKSFRPDARADTPAFAKAMKSFEGIRTAVTINPGV
jgi:hypothetical protein